jgi:hypothetical protein
MKGLLIAALVFGNLIVFVAILVILRGLKRQSQRLAELDDATQQLARMAAEETGEDIPDNGDCPAPDEMQDNDETDAPDGESEDASKTL